MRGVGGVGGDLWGVGIISRALCYHSHPTPASMSFETHRLRPLIIACLVCVYIPESPNKVGVLQ